MSKPPTSVRSIRLTDDDWAWLSARAVERETSVNALVAAMVAVARNPPQVADLKAIASALPKERAPRTATTVRLKGMWKAP